MRIVEIQAKDLKQGDVIGSQRIHGVHKHHGRDRHDRQNTPRTYVVLRKTCGSGLEMRHFEDDQHIIIKRPQYNQT